MALVLCTGRDEVLLQTRKMILEQAGHRVILAASDQEVASACERQKFDVAVLGQSVSPAAKRALSNLLRQLCPTVKILELHQAYQARAVRDADSWLEVPADVPSDLAARVSEMALNNEGSAG
jgi:CheY-like chemotaxis protein